MSIPDPAAPLITTRLDRQSTPSPILSGRTVYQHIPYYAGTLRLGGGPEESLRMSVQLGVITQDRGLEKVMERISQHFGYTLHIFESCTDFVDHSGDDDVGVVVVDGSVCSQPRLMDLQIVFNGAPNWRVLYLPRTNKKDEIKEAVELGAFGSLHKPLSEREVRQMVQSAIGI